MFNLFLRREKATRYLLGGVMLILAASMLTYLGQTGLTSADSSTTLAPRAISSGIESPEPECRGATGKVRPFSPGDDMQGEVVPWVFDVVGRGLDATLDGLLGTYWRGLRISNIERNP